MSTSTLTSRQIYRETVADVAERAKARLPEAINGRLDDAVKLVLVHDVVVQADGSIEVGSRTDPMKTYRLEGTTCTCQDFQYGKAPEGWCAHRIAAGIYKRAQEETPWQEEPLDGNEDEGWPPEEELLDEDGWPPESDDEPLPVVVLPDVSAEAVTEEIRPERLPAVQSPQTVAPLTAQALEASLAEWSAQRQVITRYIKEHFKEGVDYYTLTIKGKQTKPSLGKPGAEKFLALFHLQASFRTDEDTWEMLGRPAGVLCYCCTLTTRSGEVVGEGRGCRDIRKDDGDINKAVKMGQKSACIDAILRTGALSEVFTQDLEDLPKEEKPAVGSAQAPSDGRALLQLKQEIRRTLGTLGFAGGTEAAYKAEVQRRTGLELVPAQFQAILDALQAARTAA